MVSILSDKELRIFAKDKPELNTLVDGVRFTPEDIEQACINVIDAFNILPPPTLNGYTLESFPSRYLLQIGVWGYLLKGAAIGEASNNFNYNAGGVAINDKDKAEVFSQLGNNFWQEFVELSKQYKISQNIAQCYGSIYSEFRR